MHELAFLLAGVLGALALVFGVWALIGFLLNMSRKQGKPLEKQPKRILGVCADFSAHVMIPVWIVRGYAILYSPFLVGVLFYFCYYWLMSCFRQKAMTSSESDVEVTHITSRHY